MLYRIDRIDEKGDKSYEYVLGKRALGKWCYEIIAHDNMQIENICRLEFTYQSFITCLQHTISIHKNMTKWG